MNAKELYKECKESICNGVVDYKRIKDSLYNYTISHCYHPVKIWCYDSHLGKRVQRVVPCGICYHCRETKINEWVTRLYAHLEHFKYCYFVTLTYRSFDKNMSALDKYLFDYLRDAYWTFDTINQFNRLCYSPNVLCKKHFQDFMKRLRKNHQQNDITYFMCGEYGENYARPHAHYILFAQSPVDIEHIKKAWSLQLTEVNGEVHQTKNDSNSVTCTFGRVQVDDLVENGTLANHSLNVDGRKMSAKQCFAYVAKYVGKNKFSSKRLSILYDQYKQNIFDYENEQFNSISPQNFTEFCKPFKPFMCCSRGTPIGSLFVADNIEQMADGVFPVPQIARDNAKTGFIVPNYFRRKAAEYIYSLRRISELRSISYGNLPALATTLSNMLSREEFVSVGNLPVQDDRSNRLIIHDSQEIFVNKEFFLNSPDCFVDVKTRSRYLIAYNIPPLPHILYVQEFKYKRGVGWQHVQNYDFESWCFYYLTSMPKDFSNYMHKSMLTESNEKYLQMVEDFYTKHGLSDDLKNISKYVETNNEEFFQLKNINHLQNCNL